MEKILCKKCNEMKSDFVGRTCKDCKSKYNKEYRERNKEKIREKRREKYIRDRENILKKYNPDKARIVNKEYYLENRDVILNNKKVYRDNNKDRLNKYNAEYKKRRYHQDKCYKLRMIFSSRIRKEIKNKNRDSYLKYLGYSLNELKIHLEDQFEYWMNWDNYGIYDPETWDDKNSETWTWNIDHIIPHSEFKYNSMNDEDFKKCWSLNNLRPLSAKENCLDGSNRVRHKKD